MSLEEVYREGVRRQFEIYVSTISVCPRKEFFSYFYRPAQLYKSDETLAGEYIHRVIQEQLRRKGYEVEKEVSCDLKDGFKLVGRVDAMNNEHIIEVKTVKKFVDFNVNHWYIQVNTYMHISGVHKAKLVVVERPTGKIFIKDIEYNKDMAEGLITLAEQVVDAIKNADFTILPRCNDSRCKYCEFNIICKKI